MSDGVWCVKGMNSIRLYFKKGYNLIARTQRGEDPDDDKDYFQWFGKSSNRKDAEIRVKVIQKTHDNVEIVEFKLEEDDIE